MASTESLPPTPSQLSPYKSPQGRITRLSPIGRAIQSSPSYVDIYTGSPLSQTPSVDQYQSVSNVSHAHPSPPPRWTGPRGFGARHVNDHIPFSFWSEEENTFRPSTLPELRYISKYYNTTRIYNHRFLLVLETANPPKPVPLTVACTQAIFVPPGQGFMNFNGTALYASPRVPDPCPDLGWADYATPVRSQMTNVISALLPLAAVRRVNFWPDSIVVELVYGDAKVYGDASLPYYVAGFPTTYHHDSVPYFQSMRNHTRERLLDPQQYVGGANAGTIPQDCSNYLRDPRWGVLNPGVRVTNGPITTTGAETNVVRATTCGILLRKGSSMAVTVANHGFLDDDSNEVFHPAPNGDKIGDIVDRYPEPDIAMVRLTPANLNQFSNSTYFEAEPPKRLMGCGEIQRGVWCEVDGMSTGLLSFSFLTYAFENPVRPPGHPEIPVNKWSLIEVSRVYGASNPQLIAGICGAPFVEERTGNVHGFFHLANSEWAECAALDDLVAEGWEVV